MFFLLTWFYNRLYTFASYGLVFILIIQAHYPLLSVLEVFLIIPFFGGLHCLSSAYLHLFLYSLSDCVYKQQTYSSMHRVTNSKKNGS